MYPSNKYICDDNTKSSKLLSSDIKNYHLFCTLHGLKQLIIFFNCVKCSTSILIDHILASFPSRVSLKGFNDGGIVNLFSAHKKFRV